jgi:hypothetical protein
MQAEKVHAITSECLDNKYQISVPKFEGDIDGLVKYRWIKRHCCVPYRTYEHKEHTRLKTTIEEGHKRCVHLYIYQSLHV